MKHIFLLNESFNDNDINSIIESQARNFIDNNDLYFIKPSNDNFKQDLLNSINNIDIPNEQYFIFNPLRCVLIDSPDLQKINDLSAYLCSQHEYKYIRISKNFSSMKKMADENLSLYEDNFSKISANSPHIINKSILIEIISSSFINSLDHFWFSLDVSKWKSLFYYEKTSNQSLCCFKDQKDISTIYPIVGNFITPFGKWDVKFSEGIKGYLEKYSISSSREFSEQISGEWYNDMVKPS